LDWSRAVDWQATYTNCLSGLHVPTWSSSSTTDKNADISVLKSAYRCLLRQTGLDNDEDAIIPPSLCEECMVPLVQYIPMLYNPRLLLDDFTFLTMRDAITEIIPCVWRTRCLPVNATWVRDAMTKLHVGIGPINSFREEFDWVWKIDWQAVYTDCLSDLQVPSSSSSATIDNIDDFRQAEAACRCFLEHWPDLDVDDHFSFHDEDALKHATEHFEL
jgi:hypothetical protein